MGFRKAFCGCVSKNITTPNTQTHSKTLPYNKQLNNKLVGDLLHILDILGAKKPKFGFTKMAKDGKNHMAFPKKSDVVIMVDTAFNAFVAKKLAANEDHKLINENQIKHKSKYILIQC